MYNGANVRKMRESILKIVSATSCSMLDSGRIMPLSGWPQAWQYSPSMVAPQFWHARGAGVGIAAGMLASAVSIAIVISATLADSARPLHRLHCHMIRELL